jgi:hypothetical protein
MKNPTFLLILKALVGIDRELPPLPSMKEATPLARVADWKDPEMHSCR